MPKQPAAAEVLRVLHIVNAFSAGGMENGVANLSNWLPRSDVQMDVCSLTKADQFVNRLHPDVKVAALHRGDEMSTSTWRKLVKIIRAGKYHVVHTHNWTGLIYGIPSALLCGVPVIHGEHSELFEWEKSWRRLLLRRLLYRLCRIVHVISNDQLVQLDHYGLTAKVDLRCMPNGTDTTKFRPGSQQAARAALQLPQEGFYVGIVGRLVSTKRHELLLKAFELVGQQAPEMRLVITGSGGAQEEDIRQKCANHPLRERIHWLGGRDDMPTVYQSLDLLALTSVNEGMPNVALEAMACGIPVLANQVCGIEQIIQDGVQGRVAAMDGPETLASLLKDLQADASRLRDMGERARERIVEHFSMQIMAARYDGAYRTTATTAKT